MAYTHKNSKGMTYHLNCKKVNLKGGKTQTIYFFSSENRPATACDLPDTKKVTENPRNGVPFCRNK